MIFHNLHMPGHEGPFDVAINNNVIQSVERTGCTETTDHKVYSFKNAIIFPGLVNSHDHLDFNLFQAMGTTPYRNYTAWGKHIQQEYKDEIKNILAIPFELRAQWGAYKNLLNGFTTVVHHGPRIKSNNLPVDVVQPVQSLHSVAFEKNWKLKLNRPYRRNIPVAIHVGEGIDSFAHQEIDSLLQWNVARRKIIGIHGVAMNGRQASKFEAVVWCPASNYFMFNETAAVNFLQRHTNLLFGTDSTLTAEWNAWNHFRMARATGMVDDNAIFNMVTSNAAKAWQLKYPASIQPGKWADLVIARHNQTDEGWDRWFGINPGDILLVLRKGRIMLMDPSLQEIAEQLGSDMRSLCPITVMGKRKMINGNVERLADAIGKYAKVDSLTCFD